jgi:uncharacterized protein
MPDWLVHFIQSTSVIVLESAPWIVLSLLVGGLVHEFLPDSRLRKLLNRPGSAAMGGAVLLGGLLPICSCGVIPLAVSLYRSGVRLGPVMAFTAATPIINPAAVILSFALLGPQITFAYFLLGITLPILMGYLTQRWGEPYNANNTNNNTDTADAECKTSTDCCDSKVVASLNTASRIKHGLFWGFFTLGPNIGFYLAIGIVLAGLLNTFVPTDWMQTYLGSSSFVSLLVAALLGASIYVCAVAHIPLVAALLAAGAPPGAAIVFLVTGTATNLPELFTLYRTIGRRTVIIYTSVLILSSILAGLLVNMWLMPGFEADFDPLASLSLMDQSDRLWWTPSAIIKWSSSVVVLFLAGWGIISYLQGLLSRRNVNSDTGCCGDE